MHRFILILIVTYSINFKEVDIRNKITFSNHFAKCNNINCHSIFPVSPLDSLEDDGYFCPTCRSNMTKKHVVQCKTCLSIIGFISTFPNEAPTVFQVEKCSNCNGTSEDEKRLTPYFVQEAFI